MAASNESVVRLRRYIAEPTATTYNDVDLAEYIERYPIRDSAGNEPDATDWIVSYDLHGAAAELWFEKAAAVAADFNFTADGSTFNRSQVYEQYMKMYRMHKSRGSASSATIAISPVPTAIDSWIGNLSEQNSYGYYL